MKWITFKVISFCAAFIFMLEIIFPWIMFNNLMPMWLAILLLSITIVGGIALLDRITLHFLSKFKYHQDAI